MKVRALTSFSCTTVGAVSSGDELEMPDVLAAVRIKAGLVEEVVEPAAPAKETEQATTGKTAEKTVAAAGAEKATSSKGTEKATAAGSEKA